MFRLRLAHLLAEGVGGFDFVGVVVMLDHADGRVSRDLLEDFWVNARAASGDHEEHAARVPAVETRGAHALLAF